jgi:CheY-like chemotaxis protein
VLVVDDNQDTLLLLERYLANSPYTFVGTNQPAQVLTLLQQRSPSLVILDVMLPETDGWSLLAQIKQHPRGRDLPIAISTILPQEKLAHALGADAFLQKPFTAQQLLDLIKQLVD